MSYVLSECASPYPWAQCRYDAVDLNAFDADHDASGVLEVSLCLEGPAAGQKQNALGIYYGQYPGRKRFSYFTDAELNEGVVAGCYTRHFRPDGASCQPESGIPSVCQTACVGGRWTSLSSECLFNYNGVPLWLTAENCRGTAVSASIKQASFRYLTGPACFCAQDSDCRDLSRPICNTRAGVCVPG